MRYGQLAFFLSFCLQGKNIITILSPKKLLSFPSQPYSNVSVGRFHNEKRTLGLLVMICDIFYFLGEYDSISIPHMMYLHKPNRPFLLYLHICWTNFEPFVVNAPICDTLKTLKEHSLRKPSYGFFRGYKTRTSAKYGFRQRLFYYRKGRLSELKIQNLH